LPSSSTVAWRGGGGASRVCCSERARAESANGCPGSSYLRAKRGAAAFIVGGRGPGRRWISLGKERSKSLHRDSSRVWVGWDGASGTASNGAGRQTATEGESRAQRRGRARGGRGGHSVRTSARSAASESRGHTGRASCARPARAQAYCTRAPSRRSSHLRRASRVIRGAAPVLKSNFKGVLKVWYKSKCIYKTQRFVPPAPTPRFRGVEGAGLAGYSRRAASARGPPAFGGGGWEGTPLGAAAYRPPCAALRAARLQGAGTRPPRPRPRPWPARVQTQRRVKAFRAGGALVQRK